jgi:hypothetical protein
MLTRTLPATLLMMLVLVKMLKHNPVSTMRCLDVRSGPMPDCLYCMACWSGEGLNQLYTCAELADR